MTSIDGTQAAFDPLLATEISSQTTASQRTQAEETVRSKATTQRRRGPLRKRAAQQNTAIAQPTQHTIRETPQIAKAQTQGEDKNLRREDFPSSEDFVSAQPKTSSETPSSSRIAWTHGTYSTQSHRPSRFFFPDAPSNETSTGNLRRAAQTYAAMATQGCMTTALAPGGTGISLAV